MEKPGKEKRPQVQGLGQIYQVSKQNFEIIKSKSGEHLQINKRIKCES
jgi:hypothetical protein